MAPNLIGNSALLASTAEPVQIISPITYPTTYQRPVKRTVRASGQHQQYKLQIVWRNVMVFFFLHLGAIYGLWLAITQASWKTCLYTYIYAAFAGMGITAGAHRLWAHRTYVAKLPLRILLMIMQTTALQNHIYEWTRDHRVHHKFTETDADPHNAKRGFFFSHVGWLMVRKHKDVFIKGKTVDLSDLEADPVVMFQKKYYLILAPVFCFLIPSFFPYYYWGESWWNTFFVASIFRYTISLNFTWLVNSAAHIFGTKPYDKNIKATENTFVAWAAFGEGWHNYHHVFPWDYKAAELGNYRLNFTTAFLDLMSKIGWAYDLKTVSPHMVKKRVERTGDGSWVEHKSRKVNHDDPNHHDHGDMLWGWGDKDMNVEEVKHIKCYNKLKET
ncbi:acyl-CoA Delta(11) desaturase-like [Anoplophora glabripennis]|uniref:acyl-CoA Delta(11) desaturase-like n=1 Tax=Anoplophora glabripennis TaxID=217634 RepID=UPI00087493AC|nr:acyl-CoA Delta(11) desaturase-like [Anoplophora glabripennis]